MEVSIQYPQEPDLLTQIQAEAIAELTKEALLPLANEIDQEGAEITLIYNEVESTVVTDASPQLLERILKLVSDSEVLK